MLRQNTIVMLSLRSRTRERLFYHNNCRWNSPKQQSPDNFKGQKNDSIHQLDEN